MSVRDQLWEDFVAGGRARLIGREVELGLLGFILVQSSNRGAFVEGPPGTGKTTLVAEFVRAHRAYFSGGIIYLHGFSTKTNIKAALEEIRPTQKPSLLVFDGIDELRPPRNWVQDFFASAIARDPKLKVLATSRPGIERPPFDAVELQPLNPPEAAELLREMVGAKATPPDELVQLASGNGLILSSIAAIVRNRGGDFDAVLRSLTPFEHPGLLGPDGQPVTPKSKTGRSAISDIRHANDELILALKKDPELVFGLSPRRFEELAAGLFERLGYTVTLTPASKDGGKDLYIAQKNDLGSFLFYVECKRYAPNRPVGVALVNALTGVVERGRATAGLLLTTSHFTSGARAVQNQLKHRLSLQDYSDYKSLLERVSSPSRDWHSG
jgi:restriction system protein